MDCLENTNTVATAMFITECPKTLPFSPRKGRVGGQTTVEFALVCLPFFIILFGIIDFAEIYFYENSLQNALREAARFATAGRVIQATDSTGAPLYTNVNGVSVPLAIPSNYEVSQDASRNECIRYWFLSNCVLANFPISSIEITSAPTLPGVPANVSTNIFGQLTLLSGYSVATNTEGTVSTNSVPAVKGPGGANDYVQITATCRVSTITPLMGYIGGYGGVSNSFPVHVSAIVKNEPALLNFQHVALYSNEP